ncbi:hypothetical protein DFH07DRAFT_946607 [Mycena maculata]|uniref:Uncharacterized protein n=1 Tax=Mycena maculata TaxID=230809 RepID=A0AAD7HKT2_9AGAR|nr:hypothetical protein DFH07DRAFT_946607 [Mycena maculata]
MRVEVEANMLKVGKFVQAGKDTDERSPLNGHKFCTITTHRPIPAARASILGPAPNLPRKRFPAQRRSQIHRRLEEMTRHRRYATHDTKSQRRSEVFECFRYKSKAEEGWIPSTSFTMIEEPDGKYECFVAKNEALSGQRRGAIEKDGREEAESPDLAHLVHLDPKIAGEEALRDVQEHFDPISGWKLRCGAALQSPSFKITKWDRPLCRRKGTAPCTRQYTLRAVAPVGEARELESGGGVAVKHEETHTQDRARNRTSGGGVRAEVYIGTPLRLAQWRWDCVEEFTFSSRVSSSYHTIYAKFTRTDVAPRMHAGRYKLQTRARRRRRRQRDAWEAALVGDAPLHHPRVRPREANAAAVVGVCDVCLEEGGIGPSARFGPVLHSSSRITPKVSWKSRGNPTLKIKTTHCEKDILKVCLRQSPAAIISAEPAVSTLCLVENSTNWTKEKLGDILAYFRL